MMLRVVFLAFLVFGLAACGDDGQGPEPIACTGDIASVEVTVTTGASVRFDWEPACAVAQLLVEQNDRPAWVISSKIELGVNRITPPVTYGVTPSGLEEIIPPETLVAGDSYRLRLRRVSTAVCPQTRFLNTCLVGVGEFMR